MIPTLREPAAPVFAPAQRPACDRASDAGFAPDGRKECSNRGNPGQGFVSHAPIVEQGIAMGDSIAESDAFPQLVGQRPRNRAAIGKLIKRGARIADALAIRTAATSRRTISVPQW